MRTSQPPPRARPPRQSAEDKERLVTNSWMRAAAVAAPALPIRRGDGRDAGPGSADGCALAAGGDADGCAARRAGLRGRARAGDARRARGDGHETAHRARVRVREL